MPLLQMRPEELRVNLRRVFDDFDNDGSGTISTAEFQTILAAANVSISDAEAARLVEAADTDGSGEIDFPEFLTVIFNQKAATAGQDDGSDTVDAFIALGGNDDKTGQVSTDKLRGIIKDFGLTIDIERLIRETDLDHSGFIDYDEFKTMMKD